MIKTTEPCPDCGAPLFLDAHAETETPYYVQPRGAMPYLEMRRRPCVVAFCTGCEFAIEVRR